ncbi:hypothetical protein BDZ89DRAFT_1147320 [Hymenopellis radicata]|nr:hypothetical protein BDZ89DRAFT_1147320 [Hymenopellis radicata]
MSSAKSSQSFFIVLTDSEDEGDGCSVSTPSTISRSRKASSKAASPPRADSSDDDLLAAAFSGLSVDSPDSGKLYAIQKDGHTQVTTHWADAGYEQQHNGAQVVALSPKKPKPKTSAGAYVIFVGRQPGGGVQRRHLAILWAIYQGYLTREFATAAFKYAVRAHLVRNGLAPARSFRKVRVRNPALVVRSTDGPLSVGATHKAWYNVYSGTQPGIYASYVEAAFHFVSIPNSHHECYPSFGQARTECLRACAEGVIFVLELIPTV